jgi:cyclase
MKIRIIPTVLTDGTTVVKGTNFNNWRTIGSALATAKLFGQREVDELLFLDVNARSRGSIISKDLISDFSRNLNIPFAVGGGISALKDAEVCFRSGAEKIVLGSSALTNPALITEIANIYGAQAIVIAIDFYSLDSSEIKINSGKDF